MLGSLTGTVTAHLDSRTLVEVQGVGYWVHTGSWHPTGTITCFIHHHIREEASDLYGFPNLATLRLFEQLIGVNGIGPKAGLAILSVGSAERVAEAIVHNDTAFLSLAPGVGPKAAQRIVLDLKNKVTSDTASTSASLHEEVLAALTSLGYRPADVRPYLSELPAEHQSVDAQIKWVLQQMGGRS